MDIWNTYMPNMNAQSVTVGKLWPKFKSGSKVRVKVTYSKLMVSPERSCHREHTCQK